MSENGIERCDACGMGIGGVTHNVDGHEVCWFCEEQAEEHPEKFRELVSETEESQ